MYVIEGGGTILKGASLCDASVCFTQCSMIILGG